MTKEDKFILKKLSSHKWTNPNAFNALTSAVAFLVVVVGMLVLGLAISPLLIWLKNKGVGIGVLLCISAFITQIFIFLFGVVFCFIKKVPLFGGRARFAFDFKACLPALTLSIGTLLFLSPLHTHFAELLDSVQKSLFGGSSLDLLKLNFTAGDTLAIIIYAFILAPILPAICEELLFRGVILDGLREFGDLFAIIISGLLFALMHGNYAQTILQFVIGCEIAFAVIITGNYFVGVVMHFANNLFSVIYSLIIEFIAVGSKNLGNLTEAFMILAGLAMICIAISYCYGLTKFKEGKSNKSIYKYYRPLRISKPCCLIQKGAPLEYHFLVDHKKVVVTDNSNFLFFSGRRFHKFTGKSNRTAFLVVLLIGIVISFGLVIFDFILVG